MNRLLIFALALSSLFLKTAHADILMVDLNWNGREIAAAQAAAEKRGEKLIVLPEVSDEVRKNISDLKNQRGPLNDRFEATRRNSGANPQDLKDLSFAIWSIDQKIQKIITASGAKFNVRDVDRLLSENEKNNKSFSSIIVSGHHGAEFFFGEHGGRLKVDELKEVFARHPAQKRALSSVYLWGCYTLLTHGAREWKSAFPDLKVMGGWDDRSPSERRAVDLNVLTSLLVSEQKVTGETDGKKLSAYYKTIKDVSAGPVALCVGDSLVTHSGVENIYQNCTPGQIARSRALEKEFKKYYDAIPGFENVPSDGPGSMLRVAYKQMYRTEQCPETADINSELPLVIRLIEDDVIRKNFSTKYQDDLRKTNEFLKSQGAPPDALMPNLEDFSISRAALVAQLKRSQNYCAGLKPKGTAQSPEAGLLERFYTYVTPKRFHLKSGPPTGDAAFDQALQRAKVTTHNAHRIMSELACTDDTWVDSVGVADDLDSPNDSCLNQ